MIDQGHISFSAGSEIGVQLTPHEETHPIGRVLPHLQLFRVIFALLQSLLSPFCADCPRQIDWPNADAAVVEAVVESLGAQDVGHEVGCPRTVVVVEVEKEWLNLLLGGAERGG